MPAGAHTLQAKTNMCPVPPNLKRNRALSRAPCTARLIRSAPLLHILSIRRPPAAKWSPRTQPRSRKFDPPLPKDIFDGRAATKWNPRTQPRGRKFDPPLPKERSTPRFEYGGEGLASPPGWRSRRRTFPVVRLARKYVCLKMAGLDGIPFSFHSIPHWPCAGYHGSEFSIS